MDQGHGKALKVACNSAEARAEVLNNLSIPSTTAANVNMETHDVVSESELSVVGIECVWYQCSYCARCFPSLKMFNEHKDKYHCSPDRIKIADYEDDDDATKSEDVNDVENDEEIIMILDDDDNDEGAIENPTQSQSLLNEIGVPKQRGRPLSKKFPSKNGDLQVPVSAVTKIKTRGGPLSTKLPSKNGDLEVPVVTKKRGRPFSKNLPSKNGENVETEVGVPAVPKKRGRPFSKNIPLRNDELIVPAVPKKRGRPFSKNIPPKNDELIVPAVPKKRGRPFSKNLPSKNVELVIPAVTKKRGRPFSKYIPSQNGELAVLAVPKKRGRPFSKNLPLKNVETEVAKKKGRPFSRTIGLEISKIRGSPFSRDVEVRAPIKMGRYTYAPQVEGSQSRGPTTRGKSVSENAGKIVSKLRERILPKVQQNQEQKVAKAIAKSVSKKIQLLSKTNTAAVKGKGKEVNACGPIRLTYRIDDSMNLDSEGSKDNNKGIGMLACSYCMFRFTRIDAMRRHINAQHTKSIEYNCPYPHKPRKIYYEKRYLNKHLREIHGVQDVMNWSYEAEVGRK